MPRGDRRTLIAIVGRPNVGKSTLFNRLIRRRRAIVEDTPGVTRDRHFADVDYLERPVTFIDTGGFVPEGKEDQLERLVRQQAQAAVEACELVLLVVDGRVGVTAGDEEVARYLRKQDRPVVLLVNKCDGLKDADTLVADFHRLALGAPIAIAAEHGDGFVELAERLEPMLPSPSPSAQAEPLAGEDEDAPIRVAIVGRPNVGKSSLVNAILGEERVVVSPIAGTTRDVIDTPFTYRDRDCILTDTAGIRRKAVITQKVEGYSVMGAIRAAEDADVVVLVLDATEAGVDQDQKIAAIAEAKGRALVVCVNKWDLVKGRSGTQAEWREELKWYLKHVSWAPMVFVSARDGQGVTRVLDLALELFTQQFFRAATPMLNRVVEHVTTEHPMPWVGSRAMKIYYAMQVGTAPPSFAFICSNPKGVPERYER
ncbi:MAG: ribosome biogenesis GTPase Der, partial [Myxococcaceae bacterium]|nr:ribosome biogenesis GTPase Der [Myxococcaceae bacterium]